MLKPENFDPKDFLYKGAHSAAAWIADYLGYAMVPIEEPSPNPDPVPLPTPTPTPTPSPLAAGYAGYEKPAPGFSPPLEKAAVLNMWRGETRGMVIKPGTDVIGKATAVPVGIEVKLFRMEKITTKKPSARGLIVGEHYDPLTPVAEITGLEWGWADVWVSPDLPAGTYRFMIGELPVTVNVAAKVMPIRPTVPLYMGLSSWGIILDHKLPTDTGVAVQGPLTKKYVDMLRAHRIEPCGQFISQPLRKPDGTLDLDNWGAFGASFRQLVVSGAIAPVCVASPSNIGSAWLNEQQLAAWEKTILATPDLADAWSYTTDEPRDLAGVATRSQLIRTNAPHLKNMVTTMPTAALDQLVDHFIGVFEFYKPGILRAGRDGLYGSCMSHGSCDNAFTGNLTGTPDLMLDEPTIYSRMFAPVVACLGSVMGLYYAVNNAYMNRRDPWVDPYDFAGNGDGVLVYPGRKGERGFTEDQPVSSIRLKMIRQGLFDVEKLAALGRLKTAITDPKVWPKAHATWETLL